MADKIEKGNILGLCVIAAAIFLGAFLVIRQIIALQQSKTELAGERAADAPTPNPLKKQDVVKTVQITPVPREPDSTDAPEQHGANDNIRPGYLQVLLMGEFLPQQKHEGIEYVKAVKFQSRKGAGGVMAEVVLFNDSPRPVRPRFQVMLYNNKADYLCRDTMLYITEELPPGDTKVETLSLPHGPGGAAFFEIRDLE
jgi:hypothetical protein